MSDVTRILSQIEQGDPQAAEKLLPLVYEELRKLAAARLARENPGQTLQATALVHEAYLRLLGPAPTSDSLPPAPTFSSRAHFFSAAAEAMRRILIDNARHKATYIAGGQLARRPLDDIASSSIDADPAELLALDDALTKLEQADSQAAQLVKLRFFAGLTMDEAAQALKISSRNAYYTWDYARSFLRDILRGNDSVG